MASSAAFRPISADTAIDLFGALLAARGLQLHPALDNAVQVIGVAAIDLELHRLVPAASLTYLGSIGLRGERVFPVPPLLRHAPQLIGYYRMLLGISKKDFRQANKLGYGPWANAEERNVLSRQLEAKLDDFCAALIAPLAALVEATRPLKKLDDRDLSDLTLLTLGPTLQGKRNVVIGNKAIVGIMDSIRLAIGPWITLDTGAILQFKTPARATYELRVASDPDISLDMLLPAATGILQRRPIAALEVKGGKDVSNAHNRTGEAEKSHLKAAAAGYSHRWTIMELAGLDLARIRSETPSSTQIFDTAQIIARTGPSWDDFRANLTALLGI